MITHSHLVIDLFISVVSGGHGGLHFASNHYQVELIADHRGLTFLIVVYVLRGHHDG